MLKDTILETIREEKLFENCTGVVLAISGGSDSMTLLDFFIRNSQLPFIVGHINHCMREEADGEQKALEYYCAEHGVRCFCERIDIPALCPRGVSEETFAREKRYEYLDGLRKKYAFSHIATAHNADDNTETLLLNLIRGTGLHGAGGIPPLRDDLVARPLIRLSKASILRHCEENHIPYATDKTNFESICRRNVLRNEIIPRLRDLCDGIDSAVTRFTEDARRDEAFLSACADREYAELLTESGLDIKKCKELPYPLLSRCVRRKFRENSPNTVLTAVQTNDIIKLATDGKNNARISLPGGIIAIKQYGNLIFRQNETIPDYSQILSEGKNIIEGIGVIILEKVSQRAQLPAEYADGLIARPAKAGDRIKIYEKAGSKNIAKLYSDAKLPTDKRRKNPVLVYDGKPVFVCGFGASADALPKDGTGFKVIFTDI